MSVNLRNILFIFCYQQSNTDIFVDILANGIYVAHTMNNILFLSNTWRTRITFCCIWSPILWPLSCQATWNTFVLQVENFSVIVLRPHWSTGPNYDCASGAWLVLGGILSIYTQLIYYTISIVDDDGELMIDLLMSVTSFRKFEQ